MSRLTDVIVSAAEFDPTPLPVVDWARIGFQGPRHVQFAYPGPTGKLPTADAVIVTWTSAEWSALDHVFLNGSGTRLPAAHGWQTRWFFYGLDAPPIPAPPLPVLPAAAGLTATADAIAKVAAAIATPPPPLWGYYQLVDIVGAAGRTLRVLLFKSNSHLAHLPGLTGLQQLIEQIIRDVNPKWIYSIGTAGGTADDQRLGDVVTTNAATLLLKDPFNMSGFGWNGQTYKSDWFPPMNLMTQAQKELFFPLSTVVNYPALQSLVVKLHAQVPGSEAIALTDLVNSQICPSELHFPRNHEKPEIPLLTTDYYFIASGSDAVQYAFLEMDDAVIARIAGEHHVMSAFMRNISDPVVPSASNNGTPFSDQVRSRWSGLIYETYGLYSSYNGAVATWATLAQMA